MELVLLSPVYERGVAIHPCIERRSGVLPREVTPEILDSLSPDDVQARRSRQDLRFINAIMGNTRWIMSSLSDLPPETEIHELGAGDGVLTGRLADRGFSPRGYDLGPPPAGLSEGASWQQGDFLEEETAMRGVVAGTLILHHFKDESLCRIGQRVADASLLSFVEPLRSRVALAEAYALMPFVGKVTRHDMIASIRAGFLPGELPLALGLGDDWEVSETTTVLGGYRFLARRR